MMKRTDTSIEHRRAWDTIPWLVNGSASAEQRHAAEVHMQACDDCRDELARQRALQAALSAAPAGAPDAEAGLARLMARIDDATRDSAWAAAAAPVPRRRLGLGALVVALAGAVVLESVGIAILAFDRRGAADAPFRTLAQAAPAMPRATLRIVPSPSMTMAELQQLLLDLRLQVVAGPNEAGAYALAPLAQPPSIESQLSRLRAMPGMRFAETIAAPEAPR